MTLEQLQHILRASAEIWNETDFIIVGSQAILGEYPDVTDEIIARSIECDIYPAFAPEKLVILIGFRIYSDAF